MGEVAEGCCLSDQPGLDGGVLGSFLIFFRWSLSKSETKPSISTSTLKALAGITGGCE